ncbi:MAG: ABC-2 transporter permease [Verrucomicrobiae bacterium]|nr:ABC-2 transporter permease [Verrucomicrobiae bacterium]
MRQLFAIARNTFMELVRQPVFLLLMTASGMFGVFLAVVPYFGFGDDPKMVKDSVLAVMLVSGLVGAVLSASASLAHEIRTGTALAVLAKPVSRVQFILAKYIGLAGALTILTYFNLISALLSSRMAYDAYGSTDTLALWIYIAAVVIAYGIGAFTNYFLNRTFVADAVAALTVVGTLAFVVINFFDKEGALQTFAKGTDWRVVPAAVLILFALWILAGIALCCSTRFDMIPTLAICTAVFVLGLMSDYLFSERSNQGQWWASVLYAITPNWQLFWMADALDNQQKIPWSYVVRSLGYVVGYLGASLAFAVLLFEERELS